MKARRSRLALVLSIATVQLSCNLILDIASFTDACPEVAQGKACVDAGVDATGGDADASGTDAGNEAGATCSDGVRNGDETGVDCGGSCPACVVPSCKDKVKNGDETDVDCGGTCPPCAVDKACSGDKDCVSAVCKSSQCLAPTCSDKVKNGDESDVDCGGTSCGKCQNGQACAAPSDCTSGVCGSGTCVDSYVWGKRFKITAGSFAALTASIDGSGHAVLAGTLHGSVDFGGGPLVSGSSAEVAVARFDTSGAPMWSKRYGDTNYQAFGGVAVDASGTILISGSFAGSSDFGGGPLPNAGGQDMFLAKLDPSGAHVWSKPFGDAQDQSPPYIAIASSGDIVVSGTLLGSADFGGGTLTSAGKGDVFVARLNASGAHVWSYRFGDAQNQSVAAVVVDGTGNTVLSGAFDGVLDFGGGPLSTATGPGCFVAKLNANGSHVWSKAFGDASTVCKALVDASSNVIVSVNALGTIDFGGGPLTSAGGYDAFVAKFDPAGKHLWSKRFGGMGTESNGTVVADPAGNLVVPITSDGTIDFGGGPLTSAGKNDVFVAKLSPSGAHLWSRRFGDGQDQHVTATAAYDAENILITGFFAGAIDFGGGPLVSGGQDLFLAKLRTP